MIHVHNTVHGENKQTKKKKESALIPLFCSVPLIGATELS